MVIEPDDHDVVAVHRKFDAQIWQLGNVSPEHDWTTALDLGAYPVPPLGGIISNPLLGRCAKPTRQIQLEPSAKANQVRTEGRRAGNAGVRTGRYWWSPLPSNKQQPITKKHSSSIHLYN